MQQARCNQLPLLDAPGASQARLEHVSIACKRGRKDGMKM
jgi:hypothetical protein